VLFISYDFNIFVVIVINSFLEGLPPKSIDRPSTAVFQFVARDTNTLLVHVSKIDDFSLYKFHIIDLL